MNYSNSSLATYRMISPNKTSPRNHVIDTITIHAMAGNLSVESCGKLFAQSSRKTSSNYGIGTDGRIALYVEEKDRSWASSSSANDNRAVTIEVANDGGAPDWHVSDKALSALIDLITDICKRNNIKQLLWKADKSLIGQVDKQNMTVHRWFANKSCPGEYLFQKHFYIAEEVNKRLNNTSNPPQSSTTSSNEAYASSTSLAYKVGKTYTLQSELKVRSGAGINYSIKKHNQLTNDGKTHDKDKDGALDKGTVITCKEVKKVGKDTWIRTPSGWIAAIYQGKVYVK